MERKLNKIVKKIVFQCLGFSNKERILIVTDDKLMGVAQKFYKSIKSLDIEVSLMCFIPRLIHGEEPPLEIASALKSTDIALLITSKSLSHTQARQIASSKYGVRIASMPGITMEVIYRSLDIDYKKLAKDTRKLAKLINKGKQITVKTVQGTNFTFSIKGREALEDNGLYNKKGAFGNLPAGEVCISPLEGTSNGVVVVDGSFASLGKLKKPLRLEIKDGFVKDISDENLKNTLLKLGKSALNIAEFGIGLNPKAKVKGNVLEDEKAIGTAHIALGNNLSFGGKINAPCHLDGIFLKPLVFINGKRLI